MKETKRKLLEFLIGARRAGKTVVGYGAPGKGNTLLNYCGIRTDLMAYTVDRSPAKYGKFLPGTHIPIHPVDRIFETTALFDEASLAWLREWNAWMQAALEQNPQIVQQLHNVAVSRYDIRP